MLMVVDDADDGQARTVAERADGDTVAVSAGEDGLVINGEATTALSAFRFGPSLGTNQSRRFRRNKQTRTCPQILAYRFHCATQSRRPRNMTVSR